MRRPPAVVGNRSMRAWSASFALVLLLGFASACQRQETAASPTGYGATSGGRLEAVPRSQTGPRFQAVVAGSVTTVDRFSDPVTTVFVLAQNATNEPQVLSSTSAVLYGQSGQQLGTRLWGSRAIILPPAGQMLLAYTFERAGKWSGINVSISEPILPSVGRSPYADLQAVDSSVVSDTKGLTIKGVVKNVGNRNAYDLLAIAVGYGREGQIVAWGYSYLEQSPLTPGASRQFEATDLGGDVKAIMAHRIFLYGHQIDP